MTILSKNEFGKDEVSTFTLNKLNLAALINNVYYSNISNWSRVVIIYKSLTGSQILKVTFDCSQEIPEGTFYASAKSFDEFLVSHVEIFDFDNGSYVIKRSSLNFSEFDINLTEASLIWDMTSVVGNLTVEEGLNGQLSFIGNNPVGSQFTGVITKSLVLNYAEFFISYGSSAIYTGLAAGPGSNIGNCIYGAFQYTNGGLALIRNGQYTTNFFAIPFDGVYVRIVKKTDRLEMYCNGVLKDTLVYSGDLYGYASSSSNLRSVESFVINNNVVDEGSNNNVGTANPIAWDFITRPEYSEINSEIVSSFSSLTTNATTLLFSNEGYVFGNGIEITYTVDNSFFSGGARYSFLGVTNQAKSIYAGYYRDSGFYQHGVNNVLSTGYSLPLDQIINYKIKILPTSTEFYINDSLISLKSFAFGAQLQETDIIYPAVRFNNAYNLKGFLINSLT